MGKIIFLLVDDHRKQLESYFILVQLQNLQLFIFLSFFVSYGVPIFFMVDNIREIISAEFYISQIITVKNAH